MNAAEAMEADEVSSASASGSGATSRRTPVVGMLLLGIVVLSLIAHLVGIHRDLPSAEVDEPFFVLPAVQMASTGSLDPHWFGHPGSTVIAPLALVYRVREVVFHGAPLTGHAPGVAERFRRDATSFYLLGRLWTILLGVASVALVFVVARRVFDDVVGLIAAFCYAVVPLVVNYGRIVRTDSAGVCFGMLALWAILAAFDRPTLRRFALVGLTTGLAVASRYFLVVLVPVGVLAWWLARRRREDPVPGTWLLASGACAVGAFALVTPFFFLDWHAAYNSITAETVGKVGNSHHGWFDNLDYYLTNAIPDAISWPAYVAALVGIARAGSSGESRRLILVAYLAVFLAAISASTLQWQRWIIPVVPIFMIFASEMVVHGARRLAGRLSPHVSVRITTASLIACGSLFISALPAVALVQLERTAETPSTRQLMRAWIVEHVPRGSQIAEEVKGPELRSAGYKALSRYDLPADGTIADYVAHGYRYFVINTLLALDYRIHLHHFPKHSAFYVFLRRHGQLLTDARPVGGDTGPHLKLYRVDPAQLAAAHGRADIATTRRSLHDRLRHPPPAYPVGDELLR